MKSFDRFSFSRCFSFRPTVTPRSSDLPGQDLAQTDLKFTERGKKIIGNEIKKPLAHPSHIRCRLPGRGLLHTSVPRALPQERGGCEAPEDAIDDGGEDPLGQRGQHSDGAGARERESHPRLLRPHEVPTASHRVRARGKLGAAAEETGVSGTRVG